MFELPVEAQANHCHFGPLIENSRRGFPISGVKRTCRVGYLRGPSLFHMFLPMIMLFLLHRLGYDRRALPAQIITVWIVLPVTYLVADPVKNINFTAGWGTEPQTIIHPLLYLGLEMVLLSAVICWPAHLILQRIFGRR